MKWYIVLLYLYFVGVRAQGSRVAEKRAGVTENAVWRYWTVGLQKILFSCSFWLIENIKSYFLQVFKVRAHQVKSCSNPLCRQITLAYVQVAWWVTRTCCSDTSKRQITLCVQENFCNNLCLRNKLQKHNQTESVPLFAVTKFCCRDEDFHKNYPVHAKRFVAAMCHCDMLLQLYWPLPVRLPVLCFMILIVQKSVNIKVIMICPGCKI